MHEERMIQLIMFEISDVWFALWFVVYYHLLFFFKKMNEKDSYSPASEKKENNFSRVDSEN